MKGLEGLCLQGPFSGKWPTQVIQLSGAIPEAFLGPLCGASVGRRECCTDHTILGASQGTSHLFVQESATYQGRAWQGGIYLP